MTAEVCCFEGGFHDRLRIRGDCEQGVDSEANIASAGRGLIPGLEKALN